MKVICNQNECTGCSACVNICKHDAIKMTEDTYGELHPSINELLCTDCRLCYNTCPINNKKHHEIDSRSHCWAIWNDNKQMCKESASGGVAASLYSYWITEKQGVIYGVS